MELAERLENRLSLAIKETEAAIREAERAAETYYNRSPGRLQSLRGEYRAYMRARDIVREEAAK